MQKAILIGGTGSYSVGTSDCESSLGKLNKLLEEGWTVVSTSPMGVGGSGNGATALSLVILTNGR